MSIRNTARFVTRLTSSEIYVSVIFHTINETDQYLIFCNLKDEFNTCNAVSCGFFFKPGKAIISSGMSTVHCLHGVCTHESTERTLREKY
jgi:hypothetical protein